ncbi:hypothetical protein PSH90_12075 [Pseudomonas sp. FP1762]|uniref:hypothetical protein n=1 Tax=Pseudomonas sp. FP1762 TaxID=2954080 RepID=UPI0027339C47|nr:hypothetical protein [Pseudomonas sp. FP1762]WLG64802.1 hypothetical protein PSH90_12075 [Pseudomonas sp. FP1762]
MSSQWKLVPVEPTQSILDAMTTERKKGNGVLQMWFEAMAAAPPPPLEAEGVDFGIDGRSVRVSQEAYSIFLAREAAAREKIEALQQRLNAADQRIDDFACGECGWHREEDSGIWNSGCGETWSFHEDGPEENGMRFCHSCGKHLVVEVVEQEQDDDWHMNPCKQGHRDVGAAGGVAQCYTCDEKIEAATTKEAFEQWNEYHTAASLKSAETAAN